MKTPTSTRPEHWKNERPQRGKGRGTVRGVTTMIACALVGLAILQAGSADTPHDASGGERPPEGETIWLDVMAIHAALASGTPFDLPMGPLGNITYAGGPASFDPVIQMATETSDGYLYELLQLDFSMVRSTDHDMVGQITTSPSGQFFGTFKGKECNDFQVAIQTYEEDNGSGGSLGMRALDGLATPANMNHYGEPCPDEGSNDPQPPDPTAPARPPPEEHGITIWAWTDSAYRSAHPDASTRAVDAIFAQHGMWDAYTGNYIYGIVLYQDDFSTDPMCGDHLFEFENEHAYDPSVQGYLLFTGIELLDCLGGAFNFNGNGKISDTLSTINQGTYNPGAPNYNPSSTHHLGALSAQELGHAWGELDHPCDFYGTYSIMCNNHKWNQKAFWLTSGTYDSSAERIIRATDVFG